MGGCIKCISLFSAFVYDYRRTETVPHKVQHRIFVWSQCHTTPPLWWLSHPLLGIMLIPCFNREGGCEVIFHKRAFPCICAGCLISATVRGQRGEERDSDLYIKLWPARSAGGRRVCCSTAAALVGRSRSVSSSMLKVCPPRVSLHRTSQQCKDGSALHRAAMYRAEH